MGIGGSDGAFYEDDFDRLTGNDGNKPESGNEGSKGSRAPSDVSITFRGPSNPSGDAASGSKRTPLDPNTPGVVNPDLNPNLDTKDWNERVPDTLPAPQDVSGKAVPISDIEDRRQQSPFTAGAHFIGESMTPGAAEDLIRNPAGQAMVPNSPLGEELGMKDLPEPGQSWVDRLSMVNAFKGLAHPSFDEDINLVKGFYDKVKGAFSLMGDVYGGKIDPMSDQGIERANDLAGLMVMGPAPVAAKMADGTLGSFAGVRSLAGRTDDIATSAQVRRHFAERMEQDGAHPDDIWNKTGWMRGPEGKWKYEIDDSKATFNPEWNKNEYASGLGVRLPEVLDHPELYKAYPDLANVDVVWEPGYKGAHYDPSKDKIHVGPEYNDKSTLLHEIQHAIQEREGFARGGAPGDLGEHYDLKLQQAHDDFMTEAKRRLPEIDKKYATKGVLGLSNDDMDFIHQYSQVQRKFPEYVQAAKEETYRNYMRLAGETEARNVQARELLTQQERRNMPPSATIEPSIVNRQAVFTGSGRWATPYGYKDQYLRDTPLSKAPDNITNFRRAANDNFAEGDPRRPYNIREPDMIDTSALDEQLDRSWNSMRTRFDRGNEILDRQAELMKILGKRNWSDLEKHEFDKLSKEHGKLFPQDK